MINVFSGLHGKVLPDNFKWLNEPSNWTFTESGLIVQAEAKTDFFRDPAGTAVHDSAHYLYTEHEGDFTYTTRVQVDMLDDYDAAVMMIRLDELNWAKLCYEYTYKRPMIVSVVTQGVSDDCNSLEVPKEGIYLRVTRFDNCFAFHYSYDAKWWEMVRYFRIEARGPIQIGVVAQSPTGNGCEVKFNYLNYSSEPIKDIRSGK